MLSRAAVSVLEYVCTVHTYLYVQYEFDKEFWVLSTCT